MFEVIFTILQISLALVATKAMIVGSDFNFISWAKYGREYTRWYFNRPGFKEWKSSKSS